MTKFAGFTGKSEAAAIEAGLAALGLDRDEVAVEILERAKAGFLGIGATPAKVRLSYEGPGDEPETAPAAPVKTAAPKEEKTVYTPPKAERAPKEPPKPVLEPEPTHPVDDEASQAITAFLESNDFEDAIRNAISLGGDSDTLAAITGSIAEAAYGVPQWIQDRAWEILDEPLREVLWKWREALSRRSVV